MKKKRVKRKTRSKSIINSGKEILEKENSIVGLEKKELRELEELRKLEKEIKEKVSEHPLKKITERDIYRGLVGAFVGIVAHFAFVEGINLTERPQFTMINATLTLLTSLFIGAIFLYAAGFRRVKQVKIFSFIPARVFVIFFVAIISIIIVLSLFGFINGNSEFDEVYKQIAVISLPAMIGACGADLIGRN